LRSVATSSASLVSSWKWVANRQKAFTSLARCLQTHSCQLIALPAKHFIQNISVSCTYSAIAQAMPQPSYVEVPRPSSSMITSELLVAVCKDSVTVLLRSTETAAVFQPQEFHYLCCVRSYIGKTEMHQKHKVMRPKHTWEDNRLWGCEVKWTELAHNMIHWWGFVINFWVP
jgi:hypothetical protein